MKYHVTRYTICVPLTRAQWDKLQTREDKNYKWITDSLESSGAENVEFNGHFGRNIFFDVEDLAHVPKVTEAFLGLLKTPLKDVPDYG